MKRTLSDPVVHDHLPEGHLRRGLVADVRSGLGGRPRHVAAQVVL